MEKKYYKIFKCFFKIGILLLGGGYVILPLLKAEIADKFNEISDDDICEYYAISQCLPGLIAINTSGFVGYKILGLRGAILAVTALILPAFITIILLANIIAGLTDSSIVKNIFSGLNLGVLALVFQAINEMRKKSIVNKFSLIVFLFAFICLFGLKISPVYVILTGIAWGLLLGYLRQKNGVD